MTFSIPYVHMLPKQLRAYEDLVQTMFMNYTIGHDNWHMLHVVILKSPWQILN